MVGSSGLEPPTSRLSGVCSNLLSYEPMSYFLAGLLIFPLPYFKVNHKIKSFHYQLFTFNCPYGGDERDRTDDPLLAKQVLSQLSYTPIFKKKGVPFFSCEFPLSELIQI